MDSSQAFYQHAKQRIPGGGHLLSKRPEMFAPECWPAYFSRAQGCTVWDREGRPWLDMTHNGVGACLLGYAHPEVVEAVQDRVAAGSMSTLNPPEEVELADRLCAIHPWAGQVRLTRAGGEAAAVGVRIARASTGRSKVAVCGYHGWHDWYLAANLGDSEALRGHLLPGLDPAGTPEELRGTTLPFHYNDRAAFEALISEHGDSLAAVVMEPCRYADPDPGFLECIRDGARACGALLIFDEITIGWRTCFGGAHLRLGVTPDMALFAKALGNGHPIGAVIGAPEAMAGAQQSFISSTYWTESVGPVAALKTLEVMARARVWEHVAVIGARLQAIWREQGQRHGLPLEVPTSYPCLAHFSFAHAQANELKTLFTQQMLHHGVLASTAVYPTLAHGEAELEAYEKAVSEVFAHLAGLKTPEAIDAALEGPPAHTGFQRLM